MTDHLYHRYVDKSILTALSDTPAVFVMGPRQSGKTTLVKSIIDKSWQYITLDDQTQLTIAQNDPIGFIKNLPDRPVAIDEIQRQPNLLLTIKQIIDENRQSGKFLLTGSANALVLPQISDSLAGRVESIMLNTLSENEINQSNPSFLKKILNCQMPETKDIRIRKHIINRIITGCFPEAIKRKNQQRVRSWYKQYINALIQKDIKDIEHIDHPEKISKLLKLTTHYSAKLANFSDIGEKIGLNRITTKKYLGLLEQLFLLKQLPAWHTNNYKRLIKTPKLHLTDTGLICAIRNISTEYLSTNPGELGALLESFVYNELNKQATWFEEDLSFYHYRDKDKNEIDIIIENSANECFAIEVKASATLTQKDFSGLTRFKNIAGQRFKLGILLYDGDHGTAFGDNLFAIPLATLWS